MLDQNTSSRIYASNGHHGQSQFAPATSGQILVVIPPTLTESSFPVVERAAHVAAALRAELMLHVIRPASAAPTGNEDNVLNKALRTAKGIISQDRVTASTIIDNDISSYVRVAAARTRPTCVFVGADIDSANDFRTPSVLNQLIDACNAPLWLVETDAGTRQPIVLAAITAISRNDRPGSLNWTVLSDAAYLARAFGAELHVMHAIFQFDTDRSSLERLRKSRGTAIHQWLRTVGIPVEQLHLPIGLPDQQLTKFAETTRPQVLVLAATHYSAWRRLVEYNVTLQLAHSSPSDLLITRTGTPLFPFISPGCTFASKGST